ncbi:hypothetical protein [Streptomyces sp. NRRL S-1868]|uniref:hypothetical protein n=1 Tax=Streptomyces sp. NRRL S-1868 TaxID=1463892 RepID=UPI0004C7354C|nr:hypothetical protein [Streptomyces sp. NRRL S-1868]
MGAKYWAQEIKKAERRSPKEAAARRLDRLRSVLRRIDPALANRAWREVGDSVQRITDRYTQ